METKKKKKKLGRVLGNYVRTVRSGSKWRVILKIDHQSFVVGYPMPRRTAEWLGEMLQTAIARIEAANSERKVS